MTQNFPDRSQAEPLSSGTEQVERPGVAYPLTTSSQKLDGMRTYIEGKMKRYNLLFAVNGGAFAIAQLLADPQRTPPGHLKLHHVALGAIAFTALMGWDIWKFAQKMTGFLGDLAFGPVGKTVLIFICILIIGGWILTLS
jgi:hypothetical protein